MCIFLLFRSLVTRELASAIGFWAALANNATHILTFAAPLPPVGYNTFLVKKSAASSTAAAAATAAAAPSTVSNGVYEITLDHAAGTIGKDRSRTQPDLIHPSQRSRGNTFR